MTRYAATSSPKYKAKRAPRLILLSELYYPEETSTGYYVTRIAEHLAKSHDSVTVICSQPTYQQMGIIAPASETLNGVDVRRIKPPRFNKNNLIDRFRGFLLLSLGFLWKLLTTTRAGDTLFVLTNPPSLPVLAACLSLGRRLSIILLVHDVFPDALVAAGLTKKTSFAYYMLNSVQRWTLSRMSHIITIGRDMQSLVVSKLPPEKPPPHIIQNWADTDHITPLIRKNNPIRKAHGLENSFVIQFSGNLGRTHGLRDLVSLADRLRDTRQISFLVFGWGAGRAWLQKETHSKRLDNITILDRCSRDALPDYLTACDLFVLPLTSGMLGVSVPSRIYNVMAAGSPILGVCEPTSELDRVITEERIGWSVRPGDIDSMQDAVRDAVSNPNELLQMGNRARNAAEKKYSPTVALDKYTSVAHIATQETQRTKTLRSTT